MQDHPVHGGGPLRKKGCGILPVSIPHPLTDEKGELDTASPVQQGGEGLVDQESQKGVQQALEEGEGGVEDHQQASRPSTEGMRSWYMPMMVSRGMNEV